MHDVDVFRIGFDDWADYVLTSDAQPLADLSAVTRVVIDLGGQTLDSDVVPDFFDWTKMDEGVAILSVNFGQAALSATTYDATIITYDADNPNGVPWGTRNLRGVL